MGTPVTRVNPVAPEDSRLGLPPEVFATAFPFHLALDPDLRFVQVGRSVRKVAPEAVPGVTFASVFRIMRPEGDATIHFLRQNQSQLFLIEHIASGLTLRGEFISLDSQRLMVFLGSPWLRSALEISQRGLGFDDFAVHDPIVDLLQLGQAQIMALEDSRRLAERLIQQRADMRRANDQLQLQNHTLRTTELQLRTSEAESRKLAMVAARTDNAVIVTDAQGRVEWVNEGFTRTTGYTLMEVAGRTPGSILQGPRTDLRTVAVMREKVREGVAFRAEVQNYAKNGRLYWIAMEVQPIRDASGRLVNFMAIESDVTERRQNEQRRQLQHSVSRALAEATSLSEGIARALKSVTTTLEWTLGVFWRPEGAEQQLRCQEIWYEPREDFSEFSRQTRARILAKGEDLPGRCWALGSAVWTKEIARDLPSPRSEEAARHGLSGVIAHPCLVNGEVVGILEFYSARVEEPEAQVLEGLDSISAQLGMFVVRELAELSARRAGALQQAMFHSAAHALTAVDSQGIYLTFNPAAERLLGYSAQEMVGHESPLRIHDPEEIAARAAELERELGQPVTPGMEALLARARLGQEDERDWTLIRRDGSRVAVRLSMAVLRDENGQLAGFLGSAVDLTERRNAEAAMREGREAAEAANRAKSEFLATMSHEIRTPMNGVIGMNDLLLHSQLNDRQRELAEAIGNSASSLLEVINDVLDFSRVEAGKLKISSETFVLRPLLDSVVEVASMRTPEKRLTLAVNVAPDLPRRFCGDPIRLRQILLNLVGNAVKFTDRGSVVVRVNSAPSEAAEGRIRIEVTDTGPGLSPQESLAIFEPFVQVDSSTARRYTGSGLGLAISRRLVELMGGQIGVVSRPGVGSTFWFELPLMAIPDSDTPGFPQPLWAAQVEVATADATLAESLETQFRSWHLPVSVMPSRAALDQIGNAPKLPANTPCVLLIDEELMSADENPPVPPGFNHRILLVNPLSPWIRRNAIPQGYQQILLKPVKQSQLFDCLATALEGESGTARFTRAAIPSSASPAAGDGRVAKLRILLVEDHRTNRRLCELMLESLGLRAEVATTGIEAVDAVQKSRFDVILMDCHMPEMDGYEATKRIRAREATGCTPGEPPVYIIAVTANALLGERERCLDAGMDDYLTKPFTTKQLASALRRRPDAVSGNLPAPKSASTSQTPAFTPAQPRQMADELGWDDFESLARDFLTELPIELGRLPVHLAAGARQDLKRGAHSLKGISLTLGLTGLAEILLQLEKAAETADPDRLAHYISELSRPAEQGEKELREWLRTGRATEQSPG
jgi:PAS domain S-box-containing protein